MAVVSAPMREQMLPRPTLDPTPLEIISSARSKSASPRGALRLTAASCFLLWLSFTPVDFGPAAWVALVPALLLVRQETAPKRYLLSVYLASVVYWLVTMWWMTLGDPTMLYACIAAGIYLGCYLPLFLGTTRFAVHRLGIPMCVAAPILWTGIEYLRSFVVFSFGWYYLAHTQHLFVEIIQIADILGSYGVSFLIVLVSAAITELVPARWGQLYLRGTCQLVVQKPAAQLTQAIVAVSLFLAFYLYGTLRISQSDFQAGPRVAAIQANIPTRVGDDSDQWATYYRQHIKLTQQAVLQQADVIIWPEGMFPWPLFDAPIETSDAELEAIPNGPPPKVWRDPEARKELMANAQQASAAIMYGLQVVGPGDKKIHRYNTSLFVTPEQGIVGRYDKIHLVPFGEFIPFVESMPFLAAFTPYRGSFGLKAGTEPKAFEYKGTTFTPVICYEGTVHYLVARILRETKADVIVNQSNDGWFHGSSELDQHLITSQFRCIEFRKPMVRAVNTGISAHIDGNGVVRGIAKDPKSGKYKEVDALICDHIPLDNRTSLYLATGDWFAGSCLLGLTVVFGWSLISWVRIRRPVPAA